MLEERLMGVSERRTEYKNEGWILSRNTVIKLKFSKNKDRKC